MFFTTPTTALRRTRIFTSTATFRFTTTKNACSHCSAELAKNNTMHVQNWFYTLPQPVLEKHCHPLGSFIITASFSFAQQDTLAWHSQNRRYPRKNALHLHLVAKQPVTFGCIILRHRFIRLTKEREASER